MSSNKKDSAEASQSPIAIRDEAMEWALPSGEQGRCRGAILVRRPIRSCAIWPRRQSGIKYLVAAGAYPAGNHGFYAGH